MAIVKMKKIRLIAEIDCQSRLLESLQNWGNVEIVDLRKKIDSVPESESNSEWNLLDYSALENQAHMKAALVYLKRYNEKAESLIESFMTLRENLSRAQMTDILENFNALEKVEQFSNFDKRMSEITNRLSQLKEELKILKNWVNLDIASNDLEASDNVAFYLGMVPSTALDSFINYMDQKTSHQSHVELISQDKKDSYIVLVTPKDDQIKQTLRETAFLPVKLVQEALLPAIAVESLNAETDKLENEKANIISISKESAKEINKFEALYDYYSQQAQRHQIKKSLIETKNVSLIEGWVVADQVDALAAKLNQDYPQVLFFFDEPEEGEIPPIVLKNNGSVRPFEFVLNMYGWPNHSELDPVASLAPFFALFFAIALADAGYGLLLILGSLYFMKKYDLDAGGKKFFNLFLICGAVTVAVGLMLNGFFGNLLDVLPGFGWISSLKNKLVVIDPMLNPLGMMAITVALGVIHVWTGYAMKATVAWRRGDKVSALLDSGPWLFWLASLVFFILTNVVPGLKPFAVIGKYTAILGALSIVLTQGRGAGNIFGKLGIGLYALYNTIGPLSDTLSYTRLLALGLSGSVIAMVVNTFAVMLLDIPFVGWIFMLILLVGGHLFNIMLALLGCFIHSARLQYVEYFTKFFEGGGNPFKPFRRETKYTIVKE